MAEFEYRLEAAPRNYTDTILNRLGQEHWRVVQVLESRANEYVFLLEREVRKARDFSDEDEDTEHDVEQQGTQKQLPAAALRRRIAEALFVINKAQTIIDAGENRALASDGPVGHCREELSNREFDNMWQYVCVAVRILKTGHTNAS